MPQSRFTKQVYLELTMLRSRLKDAAHFKFLYVNPATDEYKLEEIPDVIEGIQVLMTSKIAPETFVFTEHPAFSAVVSPSVALELRAGE